MEGNNLQLRDAIHGGYVGTKQEDLWSNGKEQLVVTVFLTGQPTSGPVSARHFHRSWENLQKLRYMLDLDPKSLLTPHTQFAQLPCQ